MMALACGRTMLKFFPAEAAGGTAMLKSMYGPYKHTGVRFTPTGGVTAQNLAGYLSTPGVLAVGGSWLAKPSDIHDHAWAVVRGGHRQTAAAGTEIQDSIAFPQMTPGLKAPADKFGQWRARNQNPLVYDEA